MYFLWRCLRVYILNQKFTSWLLRRKYELQDFLNTSDEMSCPFPPAHKRHSSTNSSSSSYSQDKKQCDKQPTRHRIGHAFRNSWGRKDSDHRTAKKGNSMSMVMTFFWIMVFYFTTIFLWPFSLCSDLVSTISCKNIFIFWD